MPICVGVCLKRYFCIIVRTLQFEADRRAFIITINSFGTELGRDDRFKLYPRCGKLNPDGLWALSRADDYEQVKAVAEFYSVSISHVSNVSQRLAETNYTFVHGNAA